MNDLIKLTLSRQEAEAYQLAARQALTAAATSFPDSETAAAAQRADEKVAKALNGQALSPTVIRRIRYLVSAGMGAARRNEASDRDALAADLFRYRIIRWNDQTVETWWDRQSRNFITQIKNSSGIEISDAVYTGEKVGAANAHMAAVAQIFEQTAENTAPLPEAKTTTSKIKS